MRSLDHTFSRVLTYHFVLLFAVASPYYLYDGLTTLQGYS